MLSKRSFFNRTLFRKDLTRFWPLWGGASLGGSLMPLYILLALLANRDVDVTRAEFAYALYQVVTFVAPAVIAAYAILCAMAVWSYLYNSRSVGLMHTLPADRTGLFVTNALAGLAMTLIPFVVVGLLTCLIALFWGFLDVTAVAAAVVSVVFMTALFFGMATFCAMLTGHVVVLPVFYLLANFLAPMLEALLSTLAQAFLVGLTFNALSISEPFAPLVSIYSNFQCVTERGTDGEMEAFLTGEWVIALYALVGVVLLALAWLLYRRRQSESAGDVVAFRWLRPVFRYGVALLSALTLGRVLYELLWGAVFYYRHGDYAEFVPMCVCMAAAGVLGYYAASMLLEKSLRVFRRSWPGVVTVCAGAVLVCALVSMDVLGTERWTPDPAEVQSVYFSDYSTRLWFDETDPEGIARMVDIHNSIVADRDYIRQGRQQPYETGKCVSRYLNISYILKDGRKVDRVYDLWVTAERTADPATYDGKLLALYTSASAVRSRVEIPQGAELRSVEVYNYSSNGGSQELAEADAQALYDAILMDAAEGNVPGYDLLDDGPAYYDGLIINVEYRTWNGERMAYSHRYMDIEVYPSMTHTIQKLLELECVTQRALSSWDEAIATDRDMDLEAGPAAEVLS